LENYHESKRIETEMVRRRTQGRKEAGVFHLHPIFSAMCQEKVEEDQLRLG